MTRLTEQHISKLASQWHTYEQSLKKFSGKTLLELAAAAADVPVEQVRQNIHRLRVAVIPITSGEGLIAGFAEALASIAEHLGFIAEVVSPDEKGFREAREKGFDLCIWADDETYLAEALSTGVKAENGAATGIGFAEALLGSAEKKDEQERVLVLGAGPVGRAGAARLKAAGWEVFLCDLDRSRAEKACREHPALAGVVPCSPDELDTFDLAFPFLLDAAPTADFLPEDTLKDGAAVSAPCVPCPWHTVEKVRLWHDPLQIGTAVMLLGAAFRDASLL